MLVNVLSKHPCALEIREPKNDSGHLNREAICTYSINIHAKHRIIITGDGCLHGDGRLVRALRYVHFTLTRLNCLFFQLSKTWKSLAHVRTVVVAVYIKSVYNHDRVSMYY